jgi:hypothetical protein
VAPEHETPTVDIDHLASTCDCPAHPQVASLLAELSDIRAEVRRLRTITPSRVTSPPVNEQRPGSGRGWSGLLHFRRSLFWALADSE